MSKGDKEFENVDALEPPAHETDLGKELDGGDTGKTRIRFLQWADPHLVDETNDVVVHPALNGVLAGLVPLSVRPILFLGAAKRIVDGNAVVVIVLATRADDCTAFWPC